MSPIDTRIPHPQLPSLMQVLPAEPLLLMGAGPVPVPAEVARAGGLVINHLGPTMDMVVRHVKELARYAFQTADRHVLGIGGPASAAMEMAMGNLLWPGRRVLVLKNGWFSGRFAEMALGVGATVEILEVPEGEHVRTEQVEAALDKAHYDLLTVVQGETSSGVCSIELPAIAELCRARGVLAVVDTVCTLSTMPLKKDQWGIDVVFTGSQKGLSSLPGVSLICFSDAAWAQVEAHPGPKPHWCLDALRAQTRHRSRGFWPYTRRCDLFAKRLWNGALSATAIARWRYRRASKAWAWSWQRPLRIASTRYWRSRCQRASTTPLCAAICRGVLWWKFPVPLA
jgi:alanine-glyoxylate transaminase / serine-glyoxylate transaminase / serine-pyruvate transaminase